MKSKYRRYKRNPSELRNNPPLFTELVEFVGPGFAGFAVGRFVTRTAATQVATYKPELGKHAGAIAAVGTFLAAWFLANKWKLLEKYHTPIVVGSAIAALQSLIQLCIPQLGWMLADASPDVAAAALPATPSPPIMAPGAVAMMGLQPTNEEFDPNEFTYNEQYDPGRLDKTQVAADVNAASPDPMADFIGQTSNLGVFSN